MAGMTTVLTEFANNGNSRTSTLVGHTASQPMLVIEKRVVPDGNQSLSKYSAKVVYKTTDVDALVLPNKIIMEASVSIPINGDQGGENAAALAYFRDIVAGDEFGNSILTQEWL